MEVYLFVAVGILTSIGTVFYKLGKLTTEVKHHNQLLMDIEKRFDTLLESLKGEKK